MAWAAGCNPSSGKTVSSRVSLPASTSVKSATAVIVFETLAMRKSASGWTGAC